jgi:ankyrin repeat protein
MQIELIQAVTSRNREAAEAALARGVNVDEKDSKGETALIKAAVRGFEDMAQLLLDHGAFVDETNNGGSTALIRAVDADQPEMVRFLINHNASLGEKNHNGFTAQSLAEERSYSDIALMLQEAAETRRKLDAEKSRIAATHALALERQAWLQKNILRLHVG